jgi:hypothetical protein
MWQASPGTGKAFRQLFSGDSARKETAMRTVLLWLIGIPIPIIILLWLFGAY